VGTVGTVYAGRAATAAAASRVRDFALGSVTGGAIALLGVLVGWTLGRG
jgi:Ca2+/Na+ antiporter